ncbi:golgi transport protein 1 [Tieghemostelium lacteum]|uniref:Golgi transport protein 1 n=1 Tax=Tieghemostelium lacteum TaxID=361077 RepID=A0A151ZHZ6_TIELA|nr:golgi transport protein 1 [Tieghemostelium lacteum]|eukprot:KYQ93537.1 golgi transport protein 1 [Tieghemostelium lacteum]
MIFTDQQKIGVMLSAMGSFFSILGIFLFLDRGLLAIGNLLFISGIVLILGLHKTSKFFFQVKKIKGTICFFFGILIVIFTKWTFVGLLIEIFGFINLFGDAFPIVISVMRKLPIIGNILNYPPIARLINKTSAGEELPF